MEETIQLTESDARITFQYERSGKSPDIRQSWFAYCYQAMVCLQVTLGDLMTSPQLDSGSQSTQLSSSCARDQLPSALLLQRASRRLQGNKGWGVSSACPPLDVTGCDTFSFKGMCSGMVWKQSQPVKYWHIGPLVLQIPLGGGVQG